MANVYDIGDIIHTTTLPQSDGWVISLWQMNSINMQGDIWLGAGVSSSSPYHYYARTFKVTAGKVINNIIDSVQLDEGQLISFGLSFCKLTDTLALAIIDDYISALGQNRISYIALSIDSSGHITKLKQEYGLSVFTDSNYIESVLMCEVCDNEYMVFVAYSNDMGSTYQHCTEVITYNSDTNYISIKSHRIVPDSEHTNASFAMVRKVTDNIVISGYSASASPIASIETVEVSTSGAVGQQSQLDTFGIGDIPFMSAVAQPQFSNGWLLATYVNNYVESITVSPIDGTITFVDTGLIGGTTLGEFVRIASLGSGYFTLVGSKAVLTFSVSTVGIITDTPLDDSGSDFFNGDASHELQNVLDLGSYGGEHSRVMIAIVGLSSMSQDVLCQTFYFESAPSEASELTSFVTAITHRWMPGKFTMELMLGGLDATYKMPLMSIEEHAKLAIEALSKSVSPESINDIDVISDYVHKPVENAPIDIFSTNPPDISELPWTAGKSANVESNRTLVPDKSTMTEEEWRQYQWEKKIKKRWWPL